MSELIEASATFAGDLRRAGRLKDSGRLRPSKEGKRVRREGGRLEVEGGPFGEESKALGGYYWVEEPELQPEERPGDRRSVGGANGSPLGRILPEAT